MAKKRKTGREVRHSRRVSTATRRADQRLYVSLVSSRMNQFWLYIKRHRVSVRSALIFGGCIIVFMFVYSRVVDGALLEPYNAFTASATGFLLGLLGINIQVVGTVVSSPDFSMMIIDICTGIVPMGILISAVLAYPSTVRQKGEGIALGILVLFVLNFIRMVSLFLIGTYLPGAFDTAHYIVWQSLMILLAIGIWLFWMEKRVHVPQR